jgi:site-specific DNA-methyltransferase (adenine-specific)
VSIQLFQGNCLAVMPTLPPASVDLVLCDLPYGTTACKWDSVIPLEPLAKEYRRLCLGGVLLTAAQPFTSRLVLGLGVPFRYEWIWEKDKATGFLDAKRRPLNNYESVLCFSEKAPPYFPQMVKGKMHTRGSKQTGPGEVYSNFSNRTVTASDLYYPKRILQFPVDRKPQHPTQKPVALMEYLIKTYTNVGDTVLDNCMGSGTTGVACVNTGRNFIGIEQDATYFAIAQRRISEAQAQKEAA